MKGFQGEGRQQEERVVLRQLAGLLPPANLGLRGADDELATASLGLQAGQTPPAMLSPAAPPSPDLSLPFARPPLGQAKDSLPLARMQFAILKAKREATEFKVRVKAKICTIFENFNIICTLSLFFF